MLKRTRSGDRPGTHRFGAALRRHVGDYRLLTRLHSDRGEVFEAGLSPDGLYVSLLVNGRSGGRLVLREGADGDPPGGGIRLPFDITGHAWSRDSRWLGLTGFPRSGGRARVLVVSVPGGDIVDRTPETSPQAALLLDRGIRRIGDPVVAVRERDANGLSCLRLYRIDPDAPPRPLGPGADIDRWVLDHQDRLRAGVRWDLDGSLVILSHGEQGWREVSRLPAPEALLTHPQELTEDGRGLLLSGPFGGPHLRFGRIDLDTGETRIELDEPGHDIDEVVLRAQNRRPQLVRLAGPRAKYVALDEDTRADVVAIQAGNRADFSIEATSQDDQVWLLRLSEDQIPDRFVRWDRRTRSGTTVTAAKRPPLGRPGRTLVFACTASDGVQLDGYLTLPHAARTPAPTILLVHGGPWARDEWGFQPTRAWLAHRGFVVVQVQFRGSEGRGVEFMGQADHDWGGRMQQDLVDTARWAVAEGYADPRRLSIVGTSYGGYAALAAATFGPPLFSAAVAIAGASDLVSLTETFTTGRSYLHALFLSRLGHPGRDRELLRERSPLTHAARCHTPVLLAHGEQDAVFPVAQSRSMARALTEAGVAHELRLFPDEGHGVHQPANRVSLARQVDRFLARHSRSAPAILEEA